MRKITVLFAIALYSCIVAKKVDGSYEETLEYRFSHKSFFCLPDSLGGDSISGTVFYQLLLNREKKIHFKSIVALSAINVYTDEEINISPSMKKELIRWNYWMSLNVSEMSVDTTPKLGVNILLINTMKLDKGCPVIVPD